MDIQANTVLNTRRAIRVTRTSNASDKALLDLETVLYFLINVPIEKSFDVGRKYRVW